MDRFGVHENPLRWIPDQPNNTRIPADKVDADGYVYVETHKGLNSSPDNRLRSTCSSHGPARLLPN
jgi:hypothetical protein